MNVSLHMISLIMLMACTKKILPSTDTRSNAGRSVHVTNAAELKSALSFAKAGDNIIMGDGTYNGKFVIPFGVNGTASNPITLSGSRNAVLNAGDITTGYALHLQSNYWIIKGFTITNGLKGLMMDGSEYSIVDGIKVDHIGEEAIHLRKFSSHNTIQNCNISNTGIQTPDYGEGIYIGSAKNNWAKYSSNKPDLCDSNLILNNTIGPAVAAECIDVKEGTTATIIKGNHFDATGITGANSADSWIDVKGNYTLIENNIASNPGGDIFTDGYQVHCAYNGWGNYNQFKNNQCAVNASGFGFNVQLSGNNGKTTGNKVYDNNKVTGAAKGIANIPLSK